MQPVYEGQPDCDTCSAEEVTKLFHTCYTSITSASVAKDEAYCLHLAHDTGWDTIAVAMSDTSVAVLQTDTLKSIFKFNPSDKGITGVKFASDNNTLVWTSSSDGCVKLWDIRSNKSVKEFVGKSDKSVVTKPITAFDSSVDGKILCAGTELVQDGAYLLFWDIRGDKLLGGYWESHTDDITEVKFHPNQADTLASGSTDGLINVYDISHTSEDNALTYCMNASVTADKLSWMSRGGKCERIAALTDIYSLQYWDIKEASPLYSFSREDVAKSMRRKQPPECYLINVNTIAGQDDPVILAGSGLEHDDGYVLRLLKLDVHNGWLQPYGMLLGKQKQLMTRAAIYNGKADMYITAGECGIVRAWKREAQEIVRKEPVSKQKHRAKPY